MPAKYNHRNIQHRTWLAQNILKILTSWGFEVDTDMDMNCHEFVLSKYHKWDPGKEHVIWITRAAKNIHSTTYLAETFRNHANTHQKK